jgi:hypothetical protein
VLFNSLQFLIFLPIVFLLYFSLPHRARWPPLLVASYYFYMSWRASYILLIVASTVIDYVAGLGTESTQSQLQWRFWHYERYEYPLEILGRSRAWADDAVGKGIERTFILVPPLPFRSRIGSRPPRLGNDRVLAQVRPHQFHLRLIGSVRQRQIFSASEAWVISVLREEFIVHRGVDPTPFLSRSLLQAQGKFLLYQVIVMEMVAARRRQSQQTLAAAPPVDLQPPSRIASISESLDVTGGVLGGRKREQASRAIQLVSNLRSGWKSDARHGRLIRSVMDARCSHQHI